MEIAIYLVVFKFNFSFKRVKVARIKYKVLHKKLELRGLWSGSIFSIFFDLDLRFFFSFLLVVFNMKNSIDIFWLNDIKFTLSSNNFIILSILDADHYPFKVYVNIRFKISLELFIVGNPCIGACFGLSSYDIDLFKADKSLNCFYHSHVQ